MRRLGKRKCLLGKRRGIGGPCMAVSITASHVSRETPIGEEPRTIAGITFGTDPRERGLKMTLGELPLTAPLMQIAKLMLDPAQGADLAQGGRYLIARDCLTVVPNQRLYIADRLVKLDRTRIPQGERRAVVAERFRVCVQLPRMFAGLEKVVRGSTFLA